LFGVKVGELRVDVELGRIELVDLLVDRDGLEEEAVAGVVIGDLAEGLYRLVGAVDAHPQIADAIQRIDVVRIVVEKPLVLFDGRLDLALGDELLGVGDDLIALNRHRLARTIASILRLLRTTSCGSEWGRRPSMRPDGLPSHTPGCAENRKQGNGHDT